MTNNGRFASRVATWLDAAAYATRRAASAPGSWAIA